MKRPVLVLSLVLIFTTLSAADTGQESLETGIMPDSAFFGLEKAKESISLALTFDRQKKAEKRIKYAQKRLNAAEKLSRQGKTEEAGKAAGLYIGELEKAQRSAEGLSPDKKIEVEERINASLNGNRYVLESLRDVLPDEAATGIETALEKSRGQGEAALDSRERTDMRTGYIATGKFTRSN